MHRLLFPALAVLAVSFTAAQAAPYSKAALAAASARGVPVIVAVTAPWCPVCKAQEKVLSRLAGKYKGLTVLTIDFDSQQSTWSALGVSKQSTLIAYKGGQETGRIEYSYDAGKIERLVAGAS